MTRSAKASTLARAWARVLPYTITPGRAGTSAIHRPSFSRSISIFTLAPPGNQPIGLTATKQSGWPAVLAAERRPRTVWPQREAPADPPNCIEKRDGRQASRSLEGKQERGARGSRGAVARPQPRQRQGMAAGSVHEEFALGQYNSDLRLNPGCRRGMDQVRREPRRCRGLHGQRVCDGQIF